MFDILNSVSDVWGICPFDEVSGHLIDCRAKSRLPQNSRTIIIFAFPYLLPEDKYEGLNVSKYAAVQDYHNVVPLMLRQAADKLKALYPSEEFECFSDNSPIPEVRAAVTAGIGVKGVNSLLITEKYGSYIFLGEIVTTLPLEAKNKNFRRCIECGKCTKACPAGAIQNGIIDKSRCLSDITQRKGELTKAEAEMIKNSGCAWGCDICQNICPLNKNAATTDIKEFTETADSRVTTSTPIEGRAFGWRGEKVIKRNLEILENEI